MRQKKFKLSELETTHDRLKFIRKLACLTLKDMQEKHGIPPATLSKWESGKISLNRKSMSKCLAAFASENINVDAEWLFNGTGLQPIFISQITQDNDIDDLFISYLREKYQNCVVFEINDHAMFPKYKENETVIGDVYKGDLKNLHNRDCIVRLINNDLILRRLIINDEKSFSLIALNTDATDKPIINNAKMQYIAPVLWHKVNS